MHNPIQILLKPSDLIYSPVPTPGGHNTDFYGELDDEYNQHKSHLLRQTAELSTLLDQSRFSKIGVAKVTLRPEALAKSHRPITSLFRPDIAPILGNGGFGDLYFQVSQKSLTTIAQKISNTEEETRWKRNTSTGKLEYHPSRARSEVGAILSITPYLNAERLSFETEDALEWFENENSGKGYFVELFEYTLPLHRQYQNQTPELSRLYNSFANGLQEIGPGLNFSKLSSRGLAPNTYYVHLSSSERDPYVTFTSGLNPDQTEHQSDTSKGRHERLLRFLRNHPLVKKVSLPPAISKIHKSDSSPVNHIEFPKPEENKEYPIAGIIDTGVRAPVVKEWCIEQSAGFDANDCEENHGTQVGSLIVGAQALNGAHKILEQDGCKLYDIWTPIHPSKPSFSSYFDNLGEFFDWLDIEVENAKNTHQVRIFNFSINFSDHVSTSEYSKAATLLDEISERHNVIFVVSAGNLPRIDYRPRWPKDPDTITQYLATYGVDDRIQQPADAVRAITVGAINPEGCPDNEPGAPTIYTRRGPGVSLGVKPDLSHLGGYCSPSKRGSGLVSLNSTETPVEESGTSFAAPLVTKTLAALDFRTNYSLSREALIALLIHHSEQPNILKNKKLPKAISRQFVGFGVPKPSQEMLLTDDHSITIVFSGTLNKGQIAEFNFSWPESLVDHSGKCRGSVKLTLAYSTKTNLSFGSEYCRTNLDASLRQEKLDKNVWKYRKAVDSIWHTQLGNEATHEKTLIEHGLKWWPIKRYERKLTGVGQSANWQLALTPQVRSNEEFPEEGIDFSAILTIYDHKKQSNTVFDETRRSIQSVGVKIGSISTRADVTV